MFGTWSDAWTALGLTVAVLVAISVWGAARYAASMMAIAGDHVIDDREYTQKLLVDDMRMGVIGQQREDRTRAHQAWIYAVIAAAVLQLLPINGWLAVGLVGSVWAVVLLAHHAYDRVMVSVTLDDPLRSVSGLTWAQEIRGVLGVVTAPDLTNPLRGRWRPVGIIAAAIAATTAVVGWITIFASVRADLHDISSPASDLLGVDSRWVQAVIGVAALLVARVPLELVRRLALARPGPTDDHPIVFLRSFRDDRLSIRFGGVGRGLVDRITLRHRQGYERLLVAASQHLGRVVAVGEPGERLPPSGAFRIYLEQDDWKPTVERMLRSATFIVVSLGETPSVAWEVAALRRLGLLDRKLFLVPPVDRASRQARLTMLGEQIGIDAPLREGVGTGLAHVGVMFKDGEPVVIGAAAHDYASYHAAIMEAGFDRFEVGDGQPDS